MKSSRRGFVVGTLGLLAAGPSPSCGGQNPIRKPPASGGTGAVRGTVVVPWPEDTGAGGVDSPPNDSPPSESSPSESTPSESATVEEVPECEAQSDALPKSCEPTTSAGEGPFYKEGCPEQSNMNVDGEVGTPLIVHVRVLDGACQPRPGVRAYVWHARPTVLTYDEEGYQARGNAVTDAEGRLCFSTLFPGVYTDVASGLDLPAHFHWRFVLPDGTLFTTQFNFEGDPALEYTFHAEDLVMTLESVPGGLLIRKDIIIP